MPKRRLSVPVRPVLAAPLWIQAMQDFHDSSYKLFFDHTRMVSDLLRCFLPDDLLKTLDFDRLERMPDQYVDDRLTQSRGDTAWRIRFRGQDAEAGRWLYLLVLLEFQSTVDSFMAARISAYTGQMYLKLIRSGELAKGGRLPPVLPIVLYNGKSRWSAPEETGNLIAPVGANLAPFQLHQRYLLVDEHALRVTDLPKNNLVAVQIALEQGSLGRMSRNLQRLAVLLQGPGNESLRRVFIEWARGLAMRSDLAAADPGLAGELRRLGDTGGLEEMATIFAEKVEAFAKRHLAQGLEQGLERGLEQGLERGRKQGLERERALLVRLAERKFGAATAKRLAVLLGDVDDPVRLDEVGVAIIDCADADSLLALAKLGANGTSAVSS